MSIIKEQAETTYTYTITLKHKTTLIGLGRILRDIRHKTFFSSELRDLLNELMPYVKKAGG